MHSLLSHWWQRLQKENGVENSSSNLQLKQFDSKFGDTIDLTPLTILVGPNNSGKSQTLKDLHSSITNNKPTTLVDEVEIDFPDSVDKLLTDITSGVDDRDRPFLSGLGSNLSSAKIGNFGIEDVRKEFKNSRYRSLRSVGTFRVTYLNTSSRLEITNSCEQTNLHTNPPSNVLHMLYKLYPDVEPRLREIFQKTFEKDIMLDYSGGQLSLRIATDIGSFDEVPVHPSDLYGVVQEYPILDDEGDGYRSFVGVILSILLSRRRIVFLDEPDAFLHPAQSRELGRWIGENVPGTPNQLVLATHDSNFIEGVLESGEEVTIYRLNRVQDVTEYNKLQPSVIDQLSSDPLLSSQRVLRSIFHEGVIVCEGDSDRSVYQMTATQQLQVPDILFVHAHNKQKIKDITAVLSSANIPVACITDIDILRDHHEFKRLIQSMTDEEIDHILDLRRRIEESVSDIDEEQILEAMIQDVDKFRTQLQRGEHDLSGARSALGRLRSRSNSWTPIKDRGVEAFPEETKSQVEELVDYTSKYGVFIVPVGELEGWMDLGTSKKSTWVIRALEEIHQDNGDDDLVEFLQEIERYLDQEYSSLVEP